jgi:hypothetical protein
MSKTLKRTSAFLCITTFAVTAATSIPLFIFYLRSETVKIAVIEDLHNWSGIAFIVFALLRIALNRKFVAGAFEQLIGRKGVRY